ncbi:MAG: FGGY-family carbohydrate kinase [Rhizobiales bacterium]|nr:FGGY-family carbohydrate kinase [Hyphomicrobiales bacterium]
MTGDLVIGIDSSTTACKAIAWTPDGHAVAEGRAPIVLANPRPGWFEQEVEDWWTSCATALRQLTQKIDPSRVAGLAISNQRETFAQFDAHGRPLRPGTTWLDERAAQQVPELNGELGEGTIHRICGKPADLTPCLYRCRWFQHHMPDMWARTAMTSEVHGYLVHKLTGEWATSIASADPMGLLDLARMDWSDRLLATVGLNRGKLPRLVAPGGKIGVVSRQAAAETGVRPGTSVIAGGGDGQCAGAGVNVFAPARAYINLGTAVVSGSYAGHYAHDRAFRTLVAVGDGGYIYESCIRTGTFLVNWIMQELFAVPAGEQGAMLAKLEAEAAAVPVGSDGLAVVPYWSACMTPWWDSNARGVIAGLTSSHRRGHVYRAMLEGLALEQTISSNSIAATGSPIGEFVAIGGGAASDLWCQILADCTGRAVHRSATVEASSLGAAIAAAAGVGWYDGVNAAADAMAGRPVKTFEPEPAAHARYQELLAIYRDLWPAVSAWNARLAAFAQDERNG